MKTVSLSLFLLCLILGTPGNLTKVSSQSNDGTRAKQLWEKVIAAKGGRERLFAVHNLVVSSRTKYSRPVRSLKEGQFEDLFVLPDKWWSWGNELGITIWTYHFGRQVGREAREGLHAVVTYEPTEKRTSSAKFSSNTKEAVRFRFVQRRFIQNQLIYLMETKWLRPAIVKTWQGNIGNKRVDVIETSYGNQRFEFYVDRKTHLPAQVVILTRIEGTGTSADGSQSVDRFTLEDYIEVAGIKFPRKVTRGETNETTYQVNVDYDKGIFERPPTLDMGPEAWKLTPTPDER